MELSDGDDDCEVQTNPVILEAEEPTSKPSSAENDTVSIPAQLPTSQAMTGNIVYNNRPHIYQNYYQTYHPQMFQGQPATGNL